MYMTKKPNKAIIIGLDAPIVPRLYRFCKEGHLPTINRLFVEQGVWAKNCLVPLPTVTPPNWAAIATGAWPSTVGVTEFNVRVPGDPLDKWHAPFFSDDIRAETIYEAIAREGKKSILLNYPSTWPAKVEDSIVIGGNSLHINQWTCRGMPLIAEQPAEGTPPAMLIAYDDPGFYSTEQIRGARVLEFHEATGWKNLPEAGNLLCAEIRLRLGSEPRPGRASLYKIEPKSLYILIKDGKALVCEKEDAATAMAALAEGQWSPRLETVLQTEKGPKRATFRMKLLKFSPDTSKFQLYISNIAAVDGWSHPESIANEIVSEEGLPGCGGYGWIGYQRGWFGLDLTVELEDMENKFFADTAAYLLKNKPWNLYMMHAHTADHMYHTISNALDSPDPAARQPFEEAELAIYKSIDRMCAKIFGCADEETIMAMVSDHGAKPTTRPFRIEQILEQGGFIVRDENGMVNWSKTRAFPGQTVMMPRASTHIYINVKGREPDGIVNPGDEYRNVQEEIINYLYNYTEPTSGKKPVVLALRKEDARIIGIYGDWVGDVIYSVSGEFLGQHNPQLPTTTYGMGDLHGLFVLSGPNIKKGIELERTVWIQDLVPTICYLTGWPVPAQAEGAVIYQAMENPNER